MIYADYAATTPLDPRVLDAMMPYLTEVYGNAASTHTMGLQAHKAVLQSRMAIAGHIGAAMNDIIFTSGATEAINLAILGVARANLNSTRKRIVTVASEHLAVLDAAKHCAELGFDVVIVGVNEHGTVLSEELAAVVNENTLLVSIMAVNNETGVKQDLKPLADITHAAGALFMTDATQAYGKMHLNVEELGIDLMSFSAHKIYGPKGAGALYIRKHAVPMVQPAQFGGGQERGLRSGTMNVPGIVGLATAGTIAYQELETEKARIEGLRKEFEDIICKEGIAKVNGALADRSYNISNLLFEGIEPDLLLMHLQHVACSKGSACSSAKPKPSHVLSAMGRTPEQASQSLRFSFGRFTTHEEIQNLVNDLLSAVSLVQQPQS